MNLYKWHGTINGTERSIFALSDNIQLAQQIAIDKAPALAKNDVTRIVHASAPAISDEPTSFIYSAATQLI